MRCLIRVAFLLAGLGLAVPVWSQGLGRLFTTPEERAALNDIRNDPDFGKALEPQAIVQSEQASGPVVPNVTINGVVFRSSGINASWINGSSVSGGDTREGIRVETQRYAGGGTVRLGLPGGLETVQMKPGQKIDLTSGGIFEPYELQASEDAPLFEEVPQPADTSPAEGSAENASEGAGG